MAKNTPGAVAATEAALNEIDAAKFGPRSDDQVHKESSPILLPPGAKPFRTDADVHSDAGRRTPRTIVVMPGDEIVHYASIGRWFKAPEGHVGLNPDRNILARCEKSFVYQEGVGALYHVVKHTILRRFFKPKQCALTGANLPGGDIPLLDAAAKQYGSPTLPVGTYQANAPVAAVA